MEHDRNLEQGKLGQIGEPNRVGRGVQNLFAADDAASRRIGARESQPDHDVGLHERSVGQIT